MDILGDLTPFLLQGEHMHLYEEWTHQDQQILPRGNQSMAPQGWLLSINKRWQHLQHALSSSACRCSRSLPKVLDQQLHSQPKQFFPQSSCLPGAALPVFACDKTYLRDSARRLTVYDSCRADELGLVAIGLTGMHRGKHLQ